MPTSRQRLKRQYRQEFRWSKSLVLSFLQLFSLKLQRTYIYQQHSYCRIDKHIDICRLMCDERSPLKWYRNDSAHSFSRIGLFDKILIFKVETVDKVVG
jgi:hypothetical protein